ncbi:MAG TPA: dihydropteroate synthase [Beijerinckiaceae bacterium]|jgi:dihydropteroate synthase|nr:dihydropteroate synthase [Beijerinckiaceae bacterium]
MFEKYLYALGKGVRSVRRTLDEEARKEAVADPNAPRDVTPDDTSVAEPAATVDVSSVVPARTPLRLSHRALVMGIVNVTPDSFSDGGRYLDHAAAVAHGEQLAAEGADILDIGGESTRPGAATVTLDEEIARVVPVVRTLSARTRLPISIDTMKAKVAAAAIEAGATIVNDVWGFQFDPDIARVSAEAQVHCVLMHNRRQDDAGIDMFAEVKDFLSRSIDIALKAGVNRDNIFIDPGIGFGKTHDQSFELVRRLAELKQALGFPLLLGISRKRFIGFATTRTIASERMIGSVAADVYGALNGADIVRVHDVAAHVEAFAVLNAILGKGTERR